MPKTDLRKYAIVLGAVLFGTLPLFIRNTEMSPFQILFFRVFFGTAFLLPALIAGKEKLYPQQPKQLFLFTVAGIANMFFYIAAVRYLHVATATLLDYTGVIFAVPLSYIILRERIEKRTLAAIAVSFTGLAFLLSAYDIAANAGILFGLLAGISLAFVFVLTKMLRAKAGTLNIVFYQSLLATVMLSPLAMNMDLSKVDWAVAIGLGLVPTALARIFHVHGMKHCTAQEGSMLALFEPVSASIFAFLFLKEMLAAEQALGAVLVLAGILVLQKGKG